MKRVKGCLNSSCEDYKKTYYKESDEYCEKCGSKLSYVCKHHNCFKQIPDDVEESYCPVHLAERQDKKEKIWKVAKGIGSGLVTGITLVLTVGNAITDHAKKDK